jgi:replicative DNA helicase
MRKEEIILSALTKDIEYTKKVIPHIKADYFQDRKEKTVFSLIDNFYTKYGKLPTRDVLTLELEEAKNVSETEFDDTKSVLKSSFSDTYDYDLQWLVDETEKFCKERAVYNAIMQSVLIINGEDKKHTEGQIPSMLQDALSISFDHAIGHDYFTNAQQRYEFYTKKESRVSCSLELLNKITGGGIPRKTLNMFIAQPAGGKSLAMCSLAADYLRQGMNVLYITLELAEERIAERIDANMFNVPIQDVKTLDESVFLDRISKLKQKTHGTLKIKEYPTGSAGSSNFKILIDDLILKESFKPDVMIVDYLGITASSRYKNASGVNSYTYQKSVSEELRSLAVEYDMLLWTAVQTNRSGFNTSDFDMENISDSSGPLMTADLIMAIIRTPELDEMDQLILKQLKNRFGDPNYYRRFVVGLDKSRMKLYNVDTSAQASLQQDVDDKQTSSESTSNRYSTTKNKTKQSSKIESAEWNFDE